jgi:hypothetical protein
MSSKQEHPIQTMRFWLFGFLSVVLAVWGLHLGYTKASKRGTRPGGFLREGKTTKPLLDAAFSN